MANPYAPWSEKRIRSEAQRRLRLLFGPQEKSIRDRSVSDIQAIQGAAGAAAKILQGLAPATQAAYDTAGHSISDFAGGFTGQMADQMRTSELGADAFAQKQGASYDSPVDAGAAKNALYDLGGFIPGSSLAKQGASARAFAEAQPGIAAAGATQGVIAREQQGNQDLLDLAAKRPDALNQILDELYKRENDKAQIHIQQQAQDLYGAQFGETQRHHHVQEDQAMLSYQEQIRNHDLAMQRAKASGQKPNASLSKTYGYIVDGNGDPILDKNGNNIPVAKSGKGSAGNNSYQKAVGQASTLLGNPITKGQYDIGQGKYKSLPNKSEFKDGTTNNPKNAMHDGEMDFRQAQDFLVQRYGVTRKQARRALIAAGWPPPAVARGPRGPLPGTGPR